MPENTKRKRHFGDRRDARKVRSLPPMQYVASYIMKSRADAQIFFSSSVDCEYIDEYIRAKREEGLAGFGFMHLIVAAYIRTVASFPGVNRYISGQKIYSRHDIVLSMMVKKELKLNAQESAIKVHFSPSDTVYDVYNKMNEAIKIACAEGDTTNLDNVARAITHLPSLMLRGFVGLMNFLDYFGIMPKVIETASPFHASLFVSNLGSLGIPPIFHHIYNFGNIPMFITFGGKHKEMKVNADGSIATHNVIDYTVVSDERITDGQYLASALKNIEKIFKNPQRLDVAPETVLQDVE